MKRRLLASIFIFFAIHAVSASKPSDKHIQMIMDRYDFIGYVNKTTNPKWNKAKKPVMSAIDNDRAPDDGDILVGLITLGGDTELFSCHIYIKKTFGYDFVVATVMKDGKKTVNGKTYLTAIGHGPDDGDYPDYEICVMSAGKGYDWAHRKGRGY